MILVISHKTDYSADFVVNILNRRGIAYRRLNCEDILEGDITFRFNGNFSYSILNEDSYDAVWFRRTKLPQFKGLSPAEANYVLIETDHLLKNIFSTVSAKWLSSPKMVYEAENKLLQLKAAQKIGFTIPETLVTNSKDELRSFFAAHNGNIIIKPLSQTRLNRNDSNSFIFTNVITTDVLVRLDELDLTPCIFQENIPKDHEVRVTVVGRKVFAARIHSQGCDETRIDWRRKPLRFEIADLPSDVSDACINLVDELGLAFGALDLIKRPDGTYTFLEINPNGQWVWIENQTSLKISEAIIDYLTNV